MLIQLLLVAGATRYWKVFAVLMTTGGDRRHHLQRWQQ